MSKQIKKSDMKKKNQGGYAYLMEDEEVSLKDIKRSKEHKQYRNYENALRSKNVDRLMSYEED